MKIVLFLTYDSSKNFRTCFPIGHKDLKKNKIANESKY